MGMGDGRRWQVDLRMVHDALFLNRIMHACAHLDWQPCCFHDYYTFYIADNARYQTKN